MTIENFSSNKQLTFNYNGEKWTIHRPSIQDEINIGIMQDELLRGKARSVDEYTWVIARASARLLILVDDGPSWWNERKLEGIQSVEQLLAIDTEVTKLLQPFRANRTTTTNS